LTNKHKYDIFHTNDWQTKTTKKTKKGKTMSEKISAVDANKSGANNDEPNDSRWDLEKAQTMAVALKQDRVFNYRSDDLYDSLHNPNRINDVESDKERVDAAADYATHEFEILYNDNPELFSNMSKEEVEEVYNEHQKLLSDYHESLNRQHLVDRIKSIFQEAEEKKQQLSFHETELLFTQAYEDTLYFDYDDEDENNYGKKLAAKHLKEIYKNYYDETPRERVAKIQDALNLVRDFVDRDLEISGEKLIEFTDKLRSKSINTLPETDNHEKSLK
jgi:hypothetical protein